MKQLIKSIFKGRKAARNDQERMQDRLFVPPGHYYSPIPSIPEVMQRKDVLFDNGLDEYLGLKLNVHAQIDWLDVIRRFYKEFPFIPGKHEQFRYFFPNDYFGHADALVLFSVMMHKQPSRIVEIGSGFSSTFLLDVNDRFFNSSINLQFIEPYAGRLKDLLKENEHFSFTLFEKFVQDVELKLFEELTENDILFIDSSHVSKTGSDVNHIFFEILPRLKPGVLIHIHDIFASFEYPFEWVKQGRSWNESYLLRTFLQFNESFEILFFTSYMQKYQNSQIQDKIPGFFRI